MTLDEMIAVMQHYANGGKVESTYDFSDEFSTDSNPCWDWYNYDYRIKKEPREYYLGVYNLSGYTVAYVVDNPKDPNRVNNTLPVEIIHVVEKF